MIQIPERLLIIQDKLYKILKEVIRISNKHDLFFTLTYGSVLGSIRHSGFIPWDGDIDIGVRIDQYEEFLKYLSSELHEDMFISYYPKVPNHTAPFARIGFKDELIEQCHIDIFYFVGCHPNSVRTIINVCITSLLFALFFCKQVVPNVRYKGNKKKIIRFTIIQILIKPIKTTFIFSRFIKACNKYPICPETMCFRTVSHYNICEQIHEILPIKFLNITNVKFQDIKVPIPKDYNEYLTLMYGDYMKPPSVKEIEKSLIMFKKEDEE